MKGLSDFVQEQYSPVFNRTHRNNVAAVLKVCEKAIKAGMSKEDVCAMLDDIKTTIEKEY